MRLFKNNAFVLSFFLVLVFLNAHALQAGWYR